MEDLEFGSRVVNWRVVVLGYTAAEMQSPFE